MLDQCSGIPPVPDIPYEHRWIRKVHSLLDQGEDRPLDRKAYRSSIQNKPAATLSEVRSLRLFVSGADIFRFQARPVVWPSGPSQNIVPDTTTSVAGRPKHHVGHSRWPSRPSCGRQGSSAEVARRPRGACLAVDFRVRSAWPGWPSGSLGPLRLVPAIQAALAGRDT